jgi:hypothetical protein
MELRYLINRLIYVFLGLVEIFLGLRLILKLFGANAGNSFVNWVYEMSSVLLDPFRGIFPAPVFQSTYVLELSTIFAMIIYSILAVLLVYIVNILTKPLEDAVVVKKK